MPKDIVIVGAGRQGRNVTEILAEQKTPHDIAGFLDDTKQIRETIVGVPVLGGFDLLEDRSFVSEHRWFVALGDNRVRRRIGLGLLEFGGELVNAIHPQTSISSFARIGRGVYIAPYSRVGSNSDIQDFALIEASAHIGCDIVLGHSAFVGPGGVLTGGSAVGVLSFVGANAVISNNISVGDACIIGANAVVVRDIPSHTRAQGVPARRVAEGADR